MSVEIRLHSACLITKSNLQKPKLACKLNVRRKTQHYMPRSKQHTSVALLNQAESKLTNIGRSISALLGHLLSHNPWNIFHLPRTLVDNINPLHLQSQGHPVYISKRICSTSELSLLESEFSLAKSTCSSSSEELLLDCNSPCNQTQAQTTVLPPPLTSSEITNAPARAAVFFFFGCMAPLSPDFPLLFGLKDTAALLLPFAFAAGFLGKLPPLALTKVSREESKESLLRAQSKTSSTLIVWRFA